MAYQPPEGWVQVTRNAATGEVYSQRFHGDGQVRWGGV